ncbi:MAG TPA: type I DNA topoisomerase [Candidatus Moranbacteria bacterium]|nr:type I DNA topoisomerase [Candidatus Moranbacteria bacterium]HAT74532.1 type I DNA topoisomerase [Candidatus Moranbacteria bacterium]
MKLIIVESPTKAKTIAKFLGKNYLVKSSYGHIRDLPQKEMGVDIENDFAPQYVIPHKVADRVDELKKLAKKADGVILATDEDREGEAISWHLATALELDKRSKGAKIERIVFHEITKTAIEKALANPRELDLNLVDAQQARRVLDRLVGYELSPFLWKKIRRGLSAGRVQSMALRIIVEREKEIEKFKAEKFWKININLKTQANKKDSEFSADLIKKNDVKIEEIATLKLFAGDYKIKKTILADEKLAEEIIADLKNCRYKIENIAKRETQKTPPPPFTTSSLQQSAINSLGCSAKQTMVLAQKLYEQGYITYMRTDSFNLSLESLLSAQKTIKKLFGENYGLKNPRFFKTNSKGAQEAHEAIRPAYPEKTPEELKTILEAGQYKLYKLIWNRMIASQMSPAVFNSVKIDIFATKKTVKNIYALSASGSILTFEGYLKVYADKKNNTIDTLLPEMEIGDVLDLVSINSEEKSTSQPPRYNEATLVKVLEENGIGRPSTYAPTISTIIERKYVDKNEEKRLYPLEIGVLVSDVLTAHFPQIVDMQFTATLEKDFDEIAAGAKKWVPVIRDFYEPFHNNLKTKTKEVKKEEFQEKMDKNCPDCGGDLIMKFGRFGKFIACSNYPNCRYTEKTGEEKKLAEEFSGEICEKCGAKMAVKKGQFGSFLGCSNYPACKNIKRIENKTGIKCPKCKTGDIVERKTKKGRSFFGCNTYPACDFSVWNKPTGEFCPDCNSLMLFAAKGKSKCSKKECGFEK